MRFETTCPTIPFYGQPLPPEPPIVTSAWYWKFNDPAGMFPGIPDAFFNYIGTYNTKNQCLKRRGIWSRICNAARGIRGKSRAFNIEIENQKNSQLYRLPVELLKLIGEQLSPVSRLCMRRVCSRFRICLEHLGPELRDDVLLCTEVLQFNLLLKQDARYNLQDQYNQRCDSASLNSQLYRRGCSGCLKIHRNSNDFSAKTLSAALTISPKTRVCIGLQGSIEICEHISFSTECLLRGLHDFNKLEIRCQMHRLVRGVDGNRCARLERDAAYGPRITYHDGLRITIDRRFYLFLAPVGTNHTH
jgi:F-box domain